MTEKRREEKPLSLIDCKPIGTHGIVGRIYGGMVTIAGPCGGGHVMSIEAAGELRDWLTTTIDQTKDPS